MSWDKLKFGLMRVLFKIWMFRDIDSIFKENMDVDEYEIDIHRLNYWIIGLNQTLELLEGDRQKENYEK